MTPQSLKKIPLPTGLLVLVMTLSALAQNTPKPVTSADLKKFLTNATFKAQPREDEKQYHIFFADDGKYRLRYPSNITTATGKWSVDSKGVLCIQRVRRTGSGNKYIRTCGIVARTGKNTLQRYNDEGEHSVTLQFLGRGNQLPGGE